MIPVYIGLLLTLAACYLSFMAVHGFKTTDFRSRQLSVEYNAAPEPKKFYKRQSFKLVCEFILCMLTLASVIARMVNIEPFGSTQASVIAVLFYGTLLMIAAASYRIHRG